LLELAQAQKFPLPLKCETHVGSEDWQSHCTAVAFGKLVGMNVNVVVGPSMDCQRSMSAIYLIAGLLKFGLN
jgi:hypothetical protein